MGRNEYGISGHHFRSLKYLISNGAFEVQFFQGFIFNFNLALHFHILWSI